jgi:hypothetical protein
MPPTSLKRLVVPLVLVFAVPGAAYASPSPAPSRNPNAGEVAVFTNNVAVTPDDPGTAPAVAPALREKDNFEVVLLTDGPPSLGSDQSPNTHRPCPTRLDSLDSAALKKVADCLHQALASAGTTGALTAAKTALRDAVVIMASKANRLRLQPRVTLGPQGSLLLPPPE